MKILHISTGYPITFSGGITNYVRTLATDQADAGHDVTVLSGPIGNDAQALRFKVSEFKSALLRPFSLKLVHKDPAVTSLFDEMHGRRYDVVHFHMGLDLALQFYEGLPTLGIPYVASIHDYYLACPRIVMIDDRNVVHRAVNLDECTRCVGALHQVDAVEKARRVLSIPIPRIPSQSVYGRAEVMRRFLRSAAQVLPVSHRVEEILRTFEPDAPYHTLHIGNASATMPMPKHVPGEKIRFTMLGMMSHHKGADVLRGILENVTRPDIEFHFYGRGEKRLLSSLTSAGLIYHGAYAPKDLPQIAAHTDIGLVLPIWEDNAPQVVMEFLNYGVPVFATRMGGIPDFVHSDNGFLFDPYSPEETRAFYDRIHHLDHAGIEAYRSRIRRLKTPSQHCAEVIDLYEQALKRAVTA